MSSWREGYSMALAEALTLGVPIVSTDCDFGPREIIRNGENGLLTPVHNPEALAAGILRVLNDPALAARMRQAAPSSTQHLATPHTTSAYLELCESVRNPKR
jgi:glycosyltransferase involved in cell wall biosynthesis